MICRRLTFRKILCHLYLLWSFCKSLRPILGDTREIALALVSLYLNLRKNRSRYLHFRHFSRHVSALDKAKLSWLVSNGLKLNFANIIWCVNIRFASFKPWIGPHSSKQAWPVIWIVVSKRWEAEQKWSKIYILLMTIVTKWPDGNITICDVISEKVPYGGKNIIGSDQTPRMMCGVWSGPTIFFAHVHLK